MNLFVPVVLLGLLIPGCTPKGYFMVKLAQEVNNPRVGECFEFKLNESAVFLVGGRGYAGKTARLEYWVGDKQVGGTNPEVIPKKGAKAWPFISKEPLTVTTKLVLDGKVEEEVVVRFR